MNSSKWKKKSIEKLVTIFVSPVDKKSYSNEKDVYLCNYKDVYYNRLITSDIKFMRATASNSEIEKFALKKGDVVITKDSEDPKDIAVPSVIAENIKDLICGYHLAILRPKTDTDSNYLAYAIALPRVRYDFYRYANGITRFGLTNDTYNKVKILIPDKIEEQKSIASLLSVWDEAIEKTERVVKEKEKAKASLMKNLLTGKIRNKSFNQKWRTYYLGELFTDRKETKFNNLSLLSITRENGVIPRDEVERIDTSNNDKSKYLRICIGDIGYNTMRMWQGVSALSYLEGIVSPAYTICTPNGLVDGKYMSYLFKLPKIVNLFYRYSQGLTSDTWNLKFHNFAKIKVTIPEKAEQIEIAKILDNFDSEIELQKRKLESFKTQKRGLMQKLLTGKWQVKMDEKNKDE